MAKSSSGFDASYPRADPKSHGGRRVLAGAVANRIQVDGTRRFRIFRMVE
jgi:hypothetical protein